MVTDNQNEPIHIYIVTVFRKRNHRNIKNIKDRCHIYEQKKKMSAVKCVGFFWGVFFSESLHCITPVIYSGI